MKADLHIHSNVSFDSTNTIENILQEAYDNEFDYIAICDHNQYEGSLKAMNNSKVKVISGIEIDCYFEEDIIHVLGYGLSFNDKYFDKLRDHYDNELRRIGKLRLELIEKRYNIKLDLNKIKSLAINHPYTNVEITQVLLSDIKNDELLPYQISEKAKNPIANYYWDNLCIGKWGYVPIDLPDYKEVIKMIHRFGGVVIVAHPNVNIKMDLSKINKLIETGIDGFEAYCSYHNKNHSDFYHDICVKNNILWTSGSDYHGATKPNIKLGDTNYEGDCSIWMNPLLDIIYEKNH